MIAGANMLGVVRPVPYVHCSMDGDRIVGIGVRGMRVVVDARLSLRGVMVLIGANGSGKSTLIEACELLRSAAEALDDPVRAAVLCELDDRKRTRLLRPDPVKLGRWLERYRGLGSLRSEGYEALVMTKKHEKQ